MLLVATQTELLLLRIRAGYTSQPKLAEAAGIGVSTIVKAERHKLVQRKTAYKIVEALNVGLQARGFPPVTHNDIDWTIRD